MLNELIRPLKRWLRLVNRHSSEWLSSPTPLDGVMREWLILLGMHAGTWAERITDVQHAIRPARIGLLYVGAVCLSPIVCIVWRNGVVEAVTAGTEAAGPAAATGSAARNRGLSKHVVLGLFAVGPAIVG